MKTSVIANLKRKSMTSSSLVNEDELSEVASETDWKGKEDELKDKCRQRIEKVFSGDY